MTKEFTASFRRHPVKWVVGTLIDVGGLAVIIVHLANLL